MTFSMTGQHKGDLFRGVASIFCSASKQTWKRGGGSGGVSLLIVHMSSTDVVH